MHLSTGSLHLAALLAAFDGSTADREPTVDRGGVRVVRRTPGRIVPNAIVPSRAAPAPHWGLALGIASSATVLVLAMGLLSVVGAVALVLLA